MTDVTLAAAIRRLRVEVGSHDKLAAKLGTTRNSIIRWEKGAYPREYVDQLRELGIPERLLGQAAPAIRRDRVEALEEEVADLASALEAARLAHEELLGRVVALEKKSSARKGQRASGSSGRGRSAA